MLGSILLDPERALAAIDGFDSGNFYSERHRHIFAAMLALAESDTAITLVTLLDALHRRGALDAAGGRGYVSTLPLAVVSPENIAHHAAIVREKARLRGLITAGREIVEMAESEREDADQIIEAAEDRLRRLRAQSGNGAGLAFTEEAMRACLAEWNDESERTGIALPWNSVTLADPVKMKDAFALERGEGPTALKALGKSGKTAVAAQILVSTGMQFAATGSRELALGFFTEDSERAICERIISQLMLIPRSVWRQRPLPDWAKAARMKTMIETLPKINVRIKSFVGGTQIAAIEHVIAAAVRDGWQIGLIIIDYLQNIEWPGIEKEKPMHAEKTISRCYRWCERLGCAVLLIAQDRSVRGEDAAARVKFRRAGNQRVWGGDTLFRRCKAFTEIDLGDQDPSDQRVIRPALFYAAQGTFNAPFEVELDWAPRYGLLGDLGTLARRLTESAPTRRRLGVPEDYAERTACAEANVAEARRILRGEEQLAWNAEDREEDLPW